MMRIFNLMCFSFFLLLFNRVPLKNIEIPEIKHQYKTFNFQSSNRIKFENVKDKFDTLIPIFDGLFVTYHQIDSVYYFKYAEKKKRNSLQISYSEDLINSGTKKWGVIDSLGNVIIPFICDGVKEISENKGIVSVYSTSGSLNTGIPRYRYFGNTYFFTKNGLLPETKKEFIITIDYFADYHNSRYVIQQGPTFYLPDEYRNGKRY